MTTRTPIIGLMLVSLAPLAAQGTDKTLRGTVTIKTNGNTVAVHGKAAPPDTDFLFCIDQDPAAPPQRLEFSGQARVLYRPTPISGIPAGVAISGPESVANTLAVVADDGRTWIFVAKDQTPLVTAGNKGAATTTRVGSAVVRRLDWAAAGGPRRGTDVAGCLAPAG